MAIATSGTLLVLRCGGLGDILTAVPALRGLGRTFPAMRLAVATSAAWEPIVKAAVPASSVVHAGHLTNLSAQLGPPPTIAVNLHGKGPQSHRILQALSPGRLVGFGNAAAAAQGPRWDPEEREVARWCRLVNEELDAQASVDDIRLNGLIHLDALRPWYGDGPRVLIHPGAESAARRWPPGRFGKVAGQLRAEGCTVLVTGTPRERGRCAVIASMSGAMDMCGETNLAELAELVATADLVLCGDTGVAHLATALGTPSVVLFGPLSPQLWGATDHRLHRSLWEGDQDELRPGDPSALHCDDRLLALTWDVVFRECCDALFVNGRVARPQAGAGHTARELPPVCRD